MLLLCLLFILSPENSFSLNVTENSANTLGNPCSDKNNLVLAPGVFTAGGTNRACVSRFYPYGVARVQLTLYTGDRLSTSASRELPPGDGGCLDIAVPKLPNMQADLFVSIVYTEVQCVWERHLPIRIASGRVLIVQTERARYRPGDMVRVRMIALKSDLAPSHGMIEEAWLEGPRGAWEGTRVSQWLRVRTRLGLAQIQYQLDALAPPGKWTFRAKLEDGSQGAAVFWVGNYELPPFQLSVRHAPRVLRTTDRLAWTVCVRYPWSEAVEGMLVIRLRGAGRGGMGVRTAVQLRTPKACHRHAVAAKRVGLHSSNPPDVLVADFSFQEEGTRIWQNTTVVSQVVDKALTLEFLTKHRTVISPGLPYKLKVKATRWDDKPAANENVVVCRTATQSPIDTAHLTSRDTKSCAEGLTDVNGVARVMFPAVTNEVPFYKFEARLSNDSTTTSSLRVRVRSGAVQAALGPLKPDSWSSRTLVPLYINTHITTPITVHFVVITRGGIIYRWGATTQSPSTNTEEQKNSTPYVTKSDNYGYNQEAESEGQKDNLANYDDVAANKCANSKRCKRDFNATEMELSLLLKDLENPESNDIELNSLQENLLLDTIDQNELNDAVFPKLDISHDGVYKQALPDFHNTTEKESTQLFARVSKSQNKLQNVAIGAPWDYKKSENPFIRDTKIPEKDFAMSLRDQMEVPTVDSSTLDAKMKEKTEDTLSPDALLDRKLKVMLPIKVSHQMCPDSHLIAYFYYQGELVSASKHFEMDECFANKAEATWLTRQALPGSKVSLQVTTPGPALCALTVLDIVAKWTQQPPTTKELLTTGLRRLIDSHRNLTEYDAAGECFLNTDTPDTPTSSIELTSMWLASAGVRLVGGETPKEPRKECQSVPPALLVTEEPVPRSDFSEAWLWRLLPIGQNGTGVVNARAPDSITRFEASATCLSKTGIAVSAPAVIQVFREFFIHADGPKRLRRGDTAIIRYRIFNYLYEPLSVRVVTDPHLEEGATTETVCVRARSSTARRALVRARTATHMRLSIKATAVNDGSCPNVTSTASVSDEVIIRIAVDPEGVPVHEQKSILLCGNDSTFSTSRVEWSWPMARIVPGTETLTLWTVGDATGPLLSDADSLVMIPRGCGEQNMAQLATNLLALKHLDKLSIATLTAREHVARGFTRQLQYIHPSGGFSAFGPSDAISSTWLTAFAVRHLRKAHRLLWPNVQIPSALIRAERWLINQQMENGCFRNEGQVFHRELRGGLNEEGEIASVGLTAYVITSLIESTAALPYRVLRNSFSCLRALGPLKTQTPTRVYAQALLAYAFMSIEKYEEDLRRTNKVNLLRHLGLEEDEGVRQMLELVKVAKRSGGYVWWEATSLATSIEATSYALLALRASAPAVRARGGAADAAAARRWLAAHRSATGGFVSTQDTLVALEALTAWSSSIPTPNLNVTAECDNLSQTVMIQPGNKIPDIMRFTPGETLSVNVKGTGCALVQATRSYNTLLPPVSQDKLLSVQVAVHTDGPFDCDVRNENCFCAAVIEVCVMWSKSFPEMALLEVSLPGGYGADAQLLYSQLDQKGSLRRIELSPTNSRATLYLAGAAGGAGHECYRVHAAGPRARTRAAHVRLHDYYAPAHNDTQLFTIPEDCPPRIVHKMSEYHAADNLYDKAISPNGDEIVMTHEFTIEDIPDGIPLEDPLYDNLTKKENIEEYETTLNNEKNIQSGELDEESNTPNNNTMLNKLYSIVQDIKNYKTDVNTGKHIHISNISTEKYITPNSKVEILYPNNSIEKQILNVEEETSKPILESAVVVIQQTASNVQIKNINRDSAKVKYEFLNPNIVVKQQPPIKVQTEKQNNQMNTKNYIPQNIEVNTRPTINIETQKHNQNNYASTDKYILQSSTTVTTESAKVNIDQKQTPSSNIYTVKNIQNTKAVTEPYNQNIYVEREHNYDFDVMDIINLYDNTQKTHYTKHSRGGSTLDTFTLNNMEKSQYHNDNENKLKGISDTGNSHDIHENTNLQNDEKVKVNGLIKAGYKEETTTIKPELPAKIMFQQVPVPAYVKEAGNPNLSDFHVIDSDVDLDVPTGVEGPIPTMVLPPPNFVPPPPGGRNFKALYTSHGPYFYFRPEENSNKKLFEPKTPSAYIRPAQMYFS